MIFKGSDDSCLTRLGYICYCLTFIQRVL